MKVIIHELDVRTAILLIIWYNKRYGMIMITVGGSPACIAMRSIAGRSNGTSMFYYTYVLKSTVNGTLYVGWTYDLVHRVDEHNNKNVASTKRYAPWILVYYEACRSKEKAIEREKQLKTGFGRAYLKRRLSE